MKTWSEFATLRPDLAEPGRAACQVGVRPRLPRHHPGRWWHRSRPNMPILTDDSAFRLHRSLAQARDLRRDGRCTLHSFPLRGQRARVPLCTHHISPSSPRLAHVSFRAGGGPACTPARRRQLFDPFKDCLPTQPDNQSQRVPIPRIRSWQQDDTEHRSKRRKKGGDKASRTSSTSPSASPSAPSDHHIIPHAVTATDRVETAPAFLSPSVRLTHTCARLVYISHMTNITTSTTAATPSRQDTC